MGAAVQLRTQEEDKKTTGGRQQGQSQTSRMEYRECCGRWPHRHHYQCGNVRCQLPCLEAKLFPAAGNPRWSPAAEQNESARRLQAFQQDAPAAAATTSDVTGSLWRFEGQGWKLGALRPRCLQSCGIAGHGDECSDKLLTDASAGHGYAKGGAADAWHLGASRRPNFARRFDRYRLLPARAVSLSCRCSPVRYEECTTRALSSCGVPCPLSRAP
mmetsp:Transcript_104234/g.270144  ORF Transcript_104234/g.270144 Transcript_104234/m.270144 type:complete len:215 (-) Transcript_104234:9-653(-)